MPTAEMRKEPSVSNDFHSIVVVGASGDLARKKIYPSLFHLYYNNLLPTNFVIVGYARTDMPEAEFHEKILKNLSCRTMDKEHCQAKMAEFMKKCRYLAGQYDQPEDFKKLDTFLKGFEPAGKVANRLFYFSIPPSVFVDVATSIGKAAKASNGWNRLILEKPFGRDTESSNDLAKKLFALFDEEQLYRIDHYLGKELIQNLMVLRFANLIFEPVWDRRSVESVQILWKEDIGTEGRGGYFDQYGIIRDVMQNHLMQMLALVAMEAPASLSAEDILNEKVKVLKTIPPITMDDLVIGQYQGKDSSVGRIPSYLEDPTVPKGSITPTFAAAILQIRNRRWDGVPFMLKCGKALNERKAEIRIRFRGVPGTLFQSSGNVLHKNELVIRVQPNEAIYFRINNKIPGLSMFLDKTNLDLQYKTQFQKLDIPDAYERLILDVIRGDKSLFIRFDELEEAWKIFTPTLHQMENEKLKPTPYAFGGVGPAEATKLAEKFGVNWSDD